MSQPLSWVLAFLLSFCLLISTCCAFPRQAYRAIGALLILVCCPLQALVFLVLTSNMCTANPQLTTIPVSDTLNLLEINYFANNCQLGTAAYLAISAVVGYFWTGLLCLCLRSPTESSAATTTGSSVGTKQQQQQPPPPPSSSAPTQPPPPVAAVAVAGGTGAAATVASNGTRPTYPPPTVEPYDEENPAAIAAVAAAGGVAVGAAGMAAAARRREPPHQSHMSSEEQRDLVQAAALGAAVGASARADSMHQIPAVVRVSTEDDGDIPKEVVPHVAPVPEVIVVSEGDPEEQTDLVVAAASGAAVGSRARADTVQDVPEVIVAEGDAEAVAPVPLVIGEEEQEATDEASLSHKPDPPGSQEEPSGELGRSMEDLSDSHLDGDAEAGVDEGSDAGDSIAAAAVGTASDDDKAEISDDRSSASAVSAGEDGAGGIAAQDESGLTDEDPGVVDQSDVQPDTDGGDDDSAIDELRSESAVADDTAVTEIVPPAGDAYEATISEIATVEAIEDTLEEVKEEGAAPVVRSSDQDPMAPFDEDVSGIEAEGASSHDDASSLEDGSDGSSAVKADSYSVD